MRLVQLRNAEQRRAAGIVDGETLQLLNSFTSIYSLALAAIRSGQSMAKLAESSAAGASLPYDQVYSGESDWRLMPAFDHPEEPARCLVSGTGLTHKASVDNRQAMHASKEAALTDSMRMYQWGVEGGRPEPGTIGVQPEWFYKGSGAILCGHGEPLPVPEYAEDGGEEPEIVGAYLIDDTGRPRRVGMAVGNEFSDHKMEKRNYLYLAPSKLRRCAIGPELVVDPDFGAVTGTVRIERGGATVWSKPIASGESNMCHSLENLEHHHFKYETHRRPGDAHVHFFGAGAFSFGEGIALQEGDIMEVAFAGFGRPLRNPLKVEDGASELVRVTAIS
jgi:hypothetical protein